MEEFLRLLSRMRRIAREKGTRYMVLAATSRMKERFSQSLWYLKIFKSTRHFSLQGKKYKYFYHKYNATWSNERAVEIPIVWEMLKNNVGNVLEVGNVLQHYFEFQHDIVDKFETAEGVINEDITDLHLPKKYDAIVSISTLEHVGFDEKSINESEKLKMPEKALQALDNMRKMLNPGGTIVLTVPLGYNQHLDALIRSGRMKFDKMLCMQRISKDNRWVETEFEEIENALYGSPYPSANAIVVGIVTSRITRAMCASATKMVE